MILRKTYNTMSGFIPQRFKALLGIVLLSSSLSAQDIHFSQYFAAPFNVNPALTGYFSGDWRVGANYRTQWASVSVPYITYSAFADMNLLNKPSSKHFIGLGLSLSQDQAGDGKLTVTNIAGSLAFHKALSRLNKSYVSGGIQLSYTQKKIDFSQLYFDEQWNDFTFDRSNPPVNEIAAFKQGTYSQFDANAGVYYSSTVSDATKVYVGFAIYHLIRPHDSFYNDPNELGLRSIFTTGAYFNAGDNVIVNPSLLWQYQKYAQEFMVGGLVAYKLDNETNDKIYGGMYDRAGDAFYPVVGYEYNGLRMLMSYDVNYSKLKPASGGQGAFELSLQYTFKLKKNRPHILRMLPCPRF